jgi:hypothetical protein
VKQTSQCHKSKGPISAHRLGFIAGGLALSAISVAGQDALRLATQGETAYSNLQRTAEQLTTRPEGNIRWGPVDALFSVSVAGGYNDNVNVSRTDKEGSWFFTPFGSARLFWQPTENSSLLLDVGVGYQLYIDHSELNQFTVSPNSAISYALFIGSVRLRFSDVLNYSVNPIDVGGVSGVSRYGGLQNTFGIAADFEFQKAVLTVGYDHYNFVSTAAASDPQDGASDSLFARMSYVINPALSVGPEVAGGYMRKTEQLLNDNYHISAGGFAHWDPSDKLNLTLRLGYAYYEFLANGVLPPPSPNSSFYGTLNVTHQITDALSHALNAGHELQTGYQAANADAVELTFVNYRINLNVIRDVSLNAGVTFNHGEEFGGLSDETYNQIVFSTGAGYQLTKHLGTSVAYQFSNKNSDVEANDYSQNSVWVMLSYLF